MLTMPLLIWLSLLTGACAAPKQDGSAQADSQDSPPVDRAPSAGPLMPTIQKPLPMPPMLVTSEQQQAVQAMLQQQHNLLQQIAANVVPLQMLQPGGKPAATLATSHAAHGGSTDPGGFAQLIQQIVADSAQVNVPAPAPVPAAADQSQAHGQQNGTDNANTSGGNAQWNQVPIVRGRGDQDVLTPAVRQGRIVRGIQRASQRNQGRREWCCSICGKSNWLNVQRCRSCNTVEPDCFILFPGMSVATDPVWIGWREANQARWWQQSSAQHSQDSTGQHGQDSGQGDSAGRKSDGAQPAAMDHDPTAASSDQRPAHLPARPPLPAPGDAIDVDANDSASEEEDDAHLAGSVRDQPGQSCSAVCAATSKRRPEPSRARSQRSATPAYLPGGISGEPLRERTSRRERRRSRSRSIRMRTSRHQPQRLRFLVEVRNSPSPAHRRRRGGV